MQRRSFIGALIGGLAALPLVNRFVSAAPTESDRYVMDAVHLNDADYGRMVESWLDRSGNGNHLIQNDVVKRPQYRVEVRGIHDSDDSAPRRVFLVDEPRVTYTAKMQEMDFGYTQAEVSLYVVPL